MLNKIAMKSFDMLQEKNYYELHQNDNYLVTDIHKEDDRISLGLNSEFYITLPNRISKAISSNYEFYIELTERVQRYGLSIEYQGSDRFQFASF